MKSLYYVNATEYIMDKSGKPKKNPDGSFKVDTDLRAVIATDMGNLQSICDKDYIQWNLQSGPFPLSKFWQ